MAHAVTETADEETGRVSDKSPTVGAPRKSNRENGTRTDGEARLVEAPGSDSAARVSGPKSGTGKADKGTEEPVGDRFKSGSTVATRISVDGFVHRPNKRPDGTIDGGAELRTVPPRVDTSGFPGIVPRGDNIAPSTILMGLPCPHKCPLTFASPGFAVSPPLPRGVTNEDLLESFVFFLATEFDFFLEKPAKRKLELRDILNLRERKIKQRVRAIIKKELNKLPVTETPHRLPPHAPETSE